MGPGIPVTGGAGFHRVELRPSPVEHTAATVTAPGCSPTPPVPRRSRSPVGPGRTVVGDVADAGLADRPVADHDTVVHLAASPTTTTSPTRRPFVHTQPGRHVHARGRAAQRDPAHPRSTDEVYGDLELDDPARFTEQTPYNPRESPHSPPQGRPPTVGGAWVRSFGIHATIPNCSTTTAPVARREVHPAAGQRNVIDGGCPKLYGAGLNVAIGIPQLRPPAVPRSWSAGRSGERSPDQPTAKGSAKRGVKGKGRQQGARAGQQPGCIPARSCATSPSGDDLHHATGPGHDLSYAIDSSKIALARLETLRRLEQA